MTVPTCYRLSNYLSSLPSSISAPASSSSSSSKVRKRKKLSCFKHIAAVNTVNHVGTYRRRHRHQGLLRHLLPLAPPLLRIESVRFHRTWLAVVVIDLVSIVFKVRCMGDWF